MEILFNIQETAVLFKGVIYKRMYNYVTNKITWKDVIYGDEVGNTIFNELEKQFQELCKQF